MAWHKNFRKMPRILRSLSSRFTWYKCCNRIQHNQLDRTTFKISPLRFSPTTNSIIMNFSIAFATLLIPTAASYPHKVRGGRGSNTSFQRVLVSLLAAATRYQLVARLRRPMARIPSDNELLSHQRFFSTFPLCPFIEEERQRRWPQKEAS